MKGSVYPRPYTKDPETGKRRPMRGSTWTYSFEVTRDGKRKNVTAGGYRTKAECEAALAETLLAYGQGTHVEPSKMTLADYLRREWLPLQLAARKPSTYRGYHDICENRLIPHLGDVRLSELTSGDVVRAYNVLRASGGRRGNTPGGLSERSLKHTHSVLHSALEHACETKMLGHNPAARLPRDTRPAPKAAEMKVWGADELQRFLASVEGDRLHSLFTVAATTGMRRGELVGLRWKDVELDKGRLAVRRGRVAAGYVVHEGDTKTGRSRLIALDPETVAVLRRHRAGQLEDRLAWGEAWTDSGLVFTREDGNGYHPQAVSEAFDRRVARSGVARIRFHDLRHTCASLLLLSGAPSKVVQERLGHSSIAVTLDLYTHVMPGMDSDAAAKLGALVFGGG